LQKQIVEDNYQPQPDLTEKVRGPSACQIDDNMTDTAAQARRNVWLYVVDSGNRDDLDVLDSKGFDTWGANRRTRSGDLILMYRRAPFSDIAYVFVARSDARATAKTRDWDHKYAVDLGGGFRLPRVIKLDELRKLKELQHWSFLRHQQGIMYRRADLQEQGAWPALQKLLVERAPELPSRFGRAWNGQGPRRYVFISYASQDKRRVEILYSALSANGIDVWLDRAELRPAERFDETIAKAIASSKATILCISATWLRRRGFVKRELATALEVGGGRTNFLFPVMLTPCRIPRHFPEIHITNLYGRNRRSNLDKLVSGLKSVIAT
jgi:hypothetical protein